MSRPGSPHPANERRTRKPVADDGLRSASFAFRHRIGNGVMVVVLLLAAGQLFMLQVPRAEGLRACPTGASPPRRTLDSVIVAAAISYDRRRAD